MNDAGTIEANKSADFIVLDANPIDNITNTRSGQSICAAHRSIARQCRSINSRFSLVGVNSNQLSSGTFSA
jgi:cytosine/adenosine deaminase-related metal-dependent hydrolase